MIEKDHHYFNDRFWTSGEGLIGKRCLILEDLAFLKSKCRQQDYKDVKVEWLDY